MNVLTFLPAAERISGRRIRRTCFRQRSTLPVTAACVVANGVREALTGLVGTPIELRLLEPQIPDAAAWRAIFEGAQTVLARGSLAQAALILRPHDALAFAGAAFGEPADGVQRDLSPLERDVSFRALRALTGTLAPVCGTDVCTVPGSAGAQNFLTYFELIAAGAAAFRLGVALCSEPAAPVVQSLRLDDLAGVEVDLYVRLAQGELLARDMARLRPGTVVPMTTRIGDAGALTLSGAVLARGTCGASGDRHALLIR